MTRFTALQDFEDEETGTQYCRGMRYTIRPDNQALAVKAAAWLSEGKISTAASGGSIRGQGVVR
jgi:hypothetical protein